MFTVNELATRAKAPAQVVRYYARIGLLKPKRQQENGYRLFGKHDAQRLRFIRLAKRLGFTLGEIRQITEHADEGESPCCEVRKIVQQRIRENRTKIDAMMNLQNRMESALETWESMPDGMPDGHHVCHLIESFETELDGNVESDVNAELEC
ncbi:MAG: MerR family transcriptional regulator [Gammaproteobacteria bacterium]|nr:MerR family transcriptional regulator [Gammaproteobacteria bacterium]